MIYGIASDKISFDCVETRACGVEINEVYLCAHCGQRGGLNLDSDIIYLLSHSCASSNRT